MDVLITLLGLIKKATGLDATPFYTGENPAITYSFYRTQGDGAKGRYRLQIRTHAKTLEQAIMLNEQITDELVTLGDGTKGGLRIEANGGGSLLDEATHTPQQITYFDILAKE